MVHFCPIKCFEGPFMEHEMWWFCISRILGPWGPGAEFCQGGHFAPPEGWSRQGLNGSIILLNMLG